MSKPVAVDVIRRRIYLIRGRRVMLSADLAALYEVQPKALIQAVKRNADRFPSDFMFQLNSEEFSNLKSQFVTSSWGGMRRAYPYAFTQEGVAMLSGVLNSSRAVQVNVAIMRAFVRLRSTVLSSDELAGRVRKVERTQKAQELELGEHAVQIHEVFAAVRLLKGASRQ
jgi:phage regulator Rha-like protein